MNRFIGLIILWMSMAATYGQTIGRQNAFRWNDVLIEKPTNNPQLDVSGTVTLELVNYYDNYDFIRLYNSSLQTSSSATTTSLQTGSIRKASDGSTLAAALYYDYKGRPVNTRSISLGNRLTTVATSYKYWGDVYQTVQTDYPTTNTLIAANLVSTTTNNYNASTGLLTNTTLTLKAGYGSAVTKTIQALTYDGLGRIATNTRSGNAGAVNYSYNLHNWVTEINGLGFHEWLNYADGTNPLYNGNISTQKWQVSNESFNRGYRFTYNALNWLTEAVYGEQNFQKNDNDYNEKVLEYSANGMMKRFQRRGLKDDGEYGKIDNLHIYLNGNRPHSITDDADPQTVYGAMEFNDGSNSGQEYFYDACGSLVADANKGIAHIEYDNCNYPKKIQFTNGNTIEYVYTPDGQKLRAKYQTAIDNIVVPLNTTTNLNSSQIVNTTQTDYIGNVIYTGTSSGAITTTSLNKCLFAGGYATFYNTVPTYHYYTQDHLGNNRVVVNDNGTVEQITHYYPFGGTYADVGLNSSLQPYKYNGKELDRMHGLNWYEYGYRQYDPIVPMFTQTDPMAEKYYNTSPYVYCGNNPAKYLDPDGRDGVISVYGNYITIGAKVYLYGSGATNSVLQQMQKDINNVWGANYSIDYKGTTYNVKFDIRLSLYGGIEKNSPLIILDTLNPFSRDNYIKVSEDCQRSFVSGYDEGHWRSNGRNDKTLSQDDPAPHEVGHILGLKDQYTDEKGPNKGWEGNIMGNSKSGKVDNRNISDILKDMWQEYDNWLNEGNYGEFRYEINP